MVTRADFVLKFVPYILCEIPANAILTKFERPSIWIGIIVTAWGIVMTCSGFCQSFAGLIVCRILLGVFGEWLHSIQSNDMTTNDFNQQRPA